MNLLSFQFWLNLRPGLLTAFSQNALIVFIVALFVLAVFSFILKNRKEKNLFKRVWRGTYFFCFTNIIVGLIILFFNYEMVPFLSARFWFLIWGVEMLAWAYYLVKLLREIPKIREEAKKESEFKKYIP